MGKNIIEFKVHPYAWQLTQARQDHANITNQPMMERPYWFENTETGQAYFDIVGCLGWPGEVGESDEGLPGYIAIMGIVRPSKTMEHISASDAKFQMLDEFESKDIPTMLKSCVRLRERYGFGIQPDLLRFYYGDPERFQTTISLFNERTFTARGKEKDSVLIAPPDDFYAPKVFDVYVRAIRSVLEPAGLRLYFGNCNILKNRIREFHRDDPAVMAVGGMVQSLLNRSLWMAEVGSNVFTVDGKNERG